MQTRFGKEAAMLTKSFNNMQGAAKVQTTMQGPGMDDERSTAQFDDTMLYDDVPKGELARDKTSEDEVEMAKRDLLAKAKGVR